MAKRNISRDRKFVSKEKHEIAYDKKNPSKRKGYKVSSAKKKFAGGGTIIKKGNRVRVVNTQYDGKEGLVISNELENGNYQVQIDGKIKGFPFKNLMLLSRETYAGGGEIEKLKKYEKELWDVIKVKGQSRKNKSDTSKEIHRVQEKIKTLQSKGGSTYARGGEIMDSISDTKNHFGYEDDDWNKLSNKEQKELRIESKENLDLGRSYKSSKCSCGICPKCNGGWGINLKWW